LFVGGDKSDLLIGAEGADLLQGRGGSDLLLGGMGFDTYLYDASLGDTGLDTILDRDGSGRIVVNGQELTGGAQYGDARVSRDAQGHTYTQVGSGGGGRLVVDGKLLVEAWNAGQLGLSMTGAIASVNPVTTGTVIAGDLTPLDIDPGTPGLQNGTDSLGNVQMGAMVTTFSGAGHAHSACLNCRLPLKIRLLRRSQQRCQFRSKPHIAGELK
jgi:hypothetical protein